MVDKVKDQGRRMAPSEFERDDRLNEATGSHVETPWPGRT